MGNSGRPAMNDKDKPANPFGRVERTIIRPNPGGRLPQAPGPLPSSVETQRAPYSPPPASASPFSPAPAGFVPAPASPVPEDWIVTPATPLPQLLPEPAG